MRLSFTRFFIIFGSFFDAFGAPLALFWSLCCFFGVLVSSCWVPLACFCYFLWCLWLVWAVCGLSLLFLRRFSANVCLFVQCFTSAWRIQVVLGLWFESARATFFLLEFSNAFPVPRQVFQNRCFTCMGVLFWSNMARHLQASSLGVARSLLDHFWLHFAIKME